MVQLNDERLYYGILAITSIIIGNSGKSYMSDIKSPSKIGNRLLILFSLIGYILLIYTVGFDYSTAISVGFIAMLQCQPIMDFLERKLSKNIRFEYVKFAILAVGWIYLTYLISKKRNISANSIYIIPVMALFAEYLIPIQKDNCAVYGPSMPLMTGAWTSLIGLNAL